MIICRWFAPKASHLFSFDTVITREDLQVLLEDLLVALPMELFPNPQTLSASKRNACNVA